MYWELHAILGGLTFLLGTVVGSFLNVCIYRIPWEKSVIWPPSRCPQCLGGIAPRDNIPILGWLALGGACRNCRGRIAARYPLIELLAGLLFLGVYLLDIVPASRALIGTDPLAPILRAAYHLILVAFLVAATFIDYDLWVIPDAVTLPGMAIGLIFGGLVPGVYPDLPPAATGWEGLKLGLIGWAVGGGLIWGVRIVGGLVFRREAMGFGDVTLMAMIGAYLGWRAVFLTLFLGAILGLVHALGKLAILAGNRLAGRPTSGADHEMPFGPYLSMAALLLMFTWARYWSAWARGIVADLSDVFWWLLGRAR